MKIVVPSRGRHDLIKDRTLKLFPEATVCVDEVEAENYLEAGISEKKLMTHPSLDSLAKIRNYILDNVDDRIVIQADDDLIGCWCYVTRNMIEIRDPDAIWQIVRNTAQVADDLGVKFFGWNQTARVTYMKIHDPFKLHGWLGTIIGFVGREYRYDEELTLHVDSDYSLQNLLDNRIILADTRFHFPSSMRMRAKGGNAIHRSEKREKREMRHLKRKWGKHIGYRGTFDRLVVTVKVKRRRIKNKVS